MAPKKSESSAPKKSRTARKEFMATMQEKAQKRLTVLMTKKAKQQNLDLEIAQLRIFLGLDQGAVVGHIAAGPSFPGGFTIPADNT